MEKVYSESFRPAASRWDGLCEEDVKVTYYSNPLIFSQRTERDNEMKPGLLYRQIEEPIEEGTTGPKLVKTPTNGNNK